MPTNIRDVISDYIDRYWSFSILAVEIIVSKETFDHKSGHFNYHELKTNTNVTNKFIKFWKKKEWRKLLHTTYRNN